jgi:putative ABC transport system substrate-binding protein
MNRLPSKPLSDNLKSVGLFALALTVTFGGAVASAQQSGKVFRIGFLSPTTASGSAGVVETFRQELRKLGWVEGKNITIEARLAGLQAASRRNFSGL